MRVYLDDERGLSTFFARMKQLDIKIPLVGWTCCRWPSEVIELLKTGKVEVLSLDHDLGDKTYAEMEKRDERTGMDVIKWLEEQVYTQGFVPPPEMYVHSMNPVASKRMAHIIYRMERAVRSRGVGS